MVLTVSLDDVIPNLKIHTYFCVVIGVQHFLLAKDPFGDL